MSILSTNTQAASRPTPLPLVFIHGIKGATLMNSADEIQWLTGPQALGLSTPDLSLTPQDGLTAKGPLGEITVVPLLYKKHVYTPWLEAARKANENFHPFAYDWRRDNLESLGKFERFIEMVRKKNGGAKVRVVAHSMGGLLTLALLNKHVDWFESVVFAGVPFAGGIGFLKDLHLGDDSTFNSRILAPEVLFTFPSVYTLFATDGHGLVETNGSAIEMDFFSARQWQLKGLGIFAEKRGTEQLDFLNRALAQALKFRKLIASKNVRYPSILVVASSETPTLNRVIRAGAKSKSGWDFESAPKVAGDGRVALEDAKPPHGIPFEIFLSKFEHSELLNDPKVIERIHSR